MKLTIESRIKACNSIISQKLDEETVMANIESGFYFGVNKTSKRIWELVENNIMIADICRQLQNEYNVDSEQCEVEVLAFVEELIQEGLVEVI
jgi:hypothetical protein